MAVAPEVLVVFFDGLAHLPQSVRRDDEIETFLLHGDFLPRFPPA
jgi:hypothetical protein